MRPLHTDPICYPSLLTGTVVPIYSRSPQIAPNRSRLLQITPNCSSLLQSPVYTILLCLLPYTPDCSRQFHCGTACSEVLSLLSLLQFIHISTRWSRLFVPLVLSALAAVIVNDADIRHRFQPCSNVATSINAENIVAMTGRIL